MERLPSALVRESAPQTHIGNATNAVPVMRVPCELTEPDPPRDFSGTMRAAQ
jgi:hypothetical protein